MKIARIILTATILFSLKSTLFCSASDAAVQDETSPKPITRRPSHDGTRDGRFGSARDTFNKLGQPYRGVLGLGEEQVYAFGSDAGAAERWAPFGKTINNLVDAEKWVKAVEEKKWNLPEESMQPSLDLIGKARAKAVSSLVLGRITLDQNRAAIVDAFDQQLQIKNKEIALQTAMSDSYAKFLELQQQGTQTVRTAYQIIQENNQKRADIKATMQIKIDKILSAQQKMIESLNQQDAQNIAKVQGLVQQTQAVKKMHNQKFPQEKITDRLCIHPMEAQKLTATTLAQIAEKYDKSFADAVKLGKSSTKSVKDAAK